MQDSSDSDKSRSDEDSEASSSEEAEAFSSEVTSKNEDSNVLDEKAIESTQNPVEAVEKAKPIREDEPKPHDGVAPSNPDPGFKATVDGKKSEDSEGGTLYHVWLGLFECFRGSH